MSPLARWRTAAFAGGAVSAILTLAAAHAAATRAARTFAERSAVTVAGYLALVTPVAKGRSGYDLPQLLIQARALVTLPGWTPQVEVYHGTAPLVHGTAAPLTPADVERLRRDEAIAWVRGAAVAPLFDPDGWGVVGAVSVRAPHLGPRWFGWWGLAALALALALAAAAARAIGDEPSAWAGAFLRYRAAALLLGMAAYADAHVAVRRATDRWLTDTRALVQEAAGTPQRPALADLAGLLGGGELVPGDSGSAAPRRRSVGGVSLASVPVRLGPGRWAELRVPVGDASGYALLLGTLGLALLGPALVWIAAWGQRATRKPRYLRETVAAWAFVAPALCHIAVFSAAPLLLALYASVHRWDVADPGTAFIGLANFTRLVRDPLAWISLRNTACYALYVPVTMALALATALALPRRAWSGGAIRGLLLLPYVCSGVAVALVWEWWCEPYHWLGRPGTALPALMAAAVAVQLGYQVTLFHAGLEAIPSVYADAARVDGAGAWRRFWRITFPLLEPVTRFVFLTGVVGAFQVFTYVYVLTEGGPLHHTDTLAYRAYQVGWERLEFGYAAAITVCLCLVLLVVTRAQVRQLAREVGRA